MKLLIFYLFHFDGFPKGIKSYRLPRWFVSFMLTHPVAQDFIRWTLNTVFTEEHTVPTLARSTHRKQINKQTNKQINKQKTKQT